MSSQATELNMDVSPLAMSDEEVMNLLPPEYEQSSALPEEADASQEDEVTQDTTDEDEALDESTDEGPESAEEQADEEDQTGTPQSDTSPEQPTAETADQTIDYEAEYKRLMAPIKANGREIRIKSMDDAISLIQMGVNYNKKMAGLKPHLKVLKTLEKHQLLDEEKLGFIVDLVQKKPGAIEKFMKDSGIDPMDIDADKADSYTPGNHTIDDREIELDQVIAEIQDSPAFNRTVDLVSNKWDAKSKDELAKFPQGLKIINDHVERGIYDLIMSEVENERILGRLQGLSDLEAYRQVGDQLQAQGAFDHLGRQGHQTPSQPKVVVPNPKKEDDSKLREKRRAASPTKVGGSGAVQQEFNPLALSDEEFSKLSQQHFL